MCGMILVRNDWRYIRIWQLICVSAVHNNSHNIKLSFKINLPTSSWSRKYQCHYILGHVLGHRQWSWNPDSAMLTNCIRFYKKSLPWNTDLHRCFRTTTILQCSRDSFEIWDPKKIPIYYTIPLENCQKLPWYRNSGLTGLVLGSYAVIAKNIGKWANN
jgi:hypothetical protein